MVIPVIMVDDNFKKASALFNANAFPDRAKIDATVCGDRLAILIHSVHIVLNEPGLDRKRLLKTILDNRAFAGFAPQMDKPAILIFHNLNFVSGLYSTLIALKSLLDFYSRLIGHLIVPSTNLFGFNKDNYKSRKIAGGRFLKWIESSTPSSFTNRDELIAVVLIHIDEWLNTAIRYRDEVVHEGFIEGLQEVMLPLDKKLNEIRDIDLILPLMPDGTAVKDYCEWLLKRTQSLIKETLILMPEINFTLLSLDNA
jgi:hypothetical protein